MLQQELFFHLCLYGVCLYMLTMQELGSLLLILWFSAMLPKVELSHKT